MPVRTGYIDASYRDRPVPRRAGDDGSSDAASRPAARVRVGASDQARPLVLGLGAGLVLSLVAASLLRSFLYGLSPFDPVSYLGVGAVLSTAALVATWIPARRATRIDPASVMRAE